MDRSQRVFRFNPSEEMRMIRIAFFCPGLKIAGDYTRPGVFGFLSFFLSS